VLRSRQVLYGINTATVEVAGISVKHHSGNTGSKASFVSYTHDHRVSINQQTSSRRTTQPSLLFNGKGSMIKGRSRFMT
jgi:hypothetical protein